MALEREGLFLDRLKHQRLVGVFTLFCFLFQTFLPSYVLAFEAFEREAYVGVGLHRVDTNNFRVSVRQKNEHGNQTLVDRVVAKANLEANLDLSTLFLSPALVPAVIGYLRLLFNAEGNILLTVAGGQRLTGGVFFETDQSVLLGGVQADRLYCKSNGLTSTGNSNIAQLFHKSYGEDFSTLSIGGSFLCQNLYVDRAKLALQTDVTFGRVHVYGTVLHEEGNLKGHRLAVHEGSFSSQGLGVADVIFDTFVGENAKLVTFEQSGGEAKFKKIKGKFEKIHVKRGSTVVVSQDELVDQEHCFIDELDNDGEVSFQQRVNIKNLTNRHKAYFKGLNAHIKARIGDITWYADHLINIEPPLTAQEINDLVVKAEAYIAQKTQEALNQYIPGTGTTYEAQIRHVILLADNDNALNPQRSDIEKQEKRDEAQNKAQQLKAQALAPLQEEFEAIRWRARHEINRRTPAYRYGERDAEIRKLKEQSIGCIESGNNLTLEDAYLGDVHHLILHGGVLNVLGQSIFQGSAEIAGALNLTDSTRAEWTRFNVHDKGSVQSSGVFEAGVLTNYGTLKLAGPRSVVFGALTNHNTLVSTNTPLFLHDPCFHNEGTLQVDHLHWINGSGKKGFNAGKVIFGQVEGGFSYDNHGRLTITGPYAFQEFVNHGNDQGGFAEASFLGEGHIEKLTNAGKMKAEKKLEVGSFFLNLNYGQMDIDGGLLAREFFENHGTVQSRGVFEAGVLTNYGTLKLAGPRSAVFRALTNHNTLVSINSPLYIHDAVFNNQGTLQVDHLHWINGSGKKGINGGTAIFGQVEGGFSYDNYRKLTITGPYAFQEFVNHGNDQGGFAEASFLGEGRIEKLTNAGKMKAGQKLSIGSFFFNLSCGAMELAKLHWSKPYDYKLENHGKLTIHQCDGQHYPKAIVNCEGGRMYFRHLLGRVDGALFNDRSNEHSGIVDGVEFSDIQNYGTLFLYHGCYYAHNLHNPGTLSIGENAQDGTMFNATQVSNPGRIEKQGNFFIKQRGQNWGDLFASGELRLVCMKGLNGADQLRDSYKAGKIVLRAEAFQNTQNRDARHQNVCLVAEVFYNNARMLFKEFDLNAASFQQENMGVIGTTGDISIKLAEAIYGTQATLNLSENVDNRHGIIHAQGNVSIQGGGKLLNGAFIDGESTARRHNGYADAREEYFYDKNALVSEIEHLKKQIPIYKQRVDHLQGQLKVLERCSGGHAMESYERIAEELNEPQTSLASLTSALQQKEQALNNLLVFEPVFATEPLRLEKKGNGAYIQAGGHLHIDVKKSVENSGGSLVAGGVTDQPYALWIKAVDGFVGQAGFIESGGKTRFEGSALSLLTEGYQVIDQPGGENNDCGVLQRICHYKAATQHPSLMVRGDFECAVDQVDFYGANVGILGRMFNKNGETVSLQQPTYFKMRAFPYFQTSFEKYKKSKASWWHNTTYRYTVHRGLTSHTPTSINVGGGINLQFHQYQFEGCGLLQGANVNLMGIQLVANGGDFGVAINPLQKVVMKLEGGVLIALAPLVLSHHPLIQSPHHGVVYQDPVFGGERPVSQRYIVGANPEGHNHAILEGAKAGRDVTLQQALGQEALLLGVMQAFSLNGVNLSRIRVQQNVWDMLKPMFEAAVQLKTEQRASPCLALAAMHSSEHPLIAFMERLTVVEGFGTVPVLYPFLYLPALFCKKLEKKFKIVAGENGDIIIQVWDLKAKKLALHSPSNHVIVEGNRILLDDCDVKSKNTIFMANHRLKDNTILEGSFIDLGSLHETDNLTVRSTGPIVFGVSRVIYEREVDAGNHKEKDFMNIAKVGNIKAKKALIESMGGSDVVFEGTTITCPNTQLKMNGGRVHFKAARSQFYTYRFDDDSDLLVQDVEQSMRADTTFVLPNISHTLDIQGASSVVLDKIEKVQKKSGANGYYTNVMLAMMADFNVSAEESQIYDVFSKLPDNLKDKIEYQMVKEVRAYEHVHHVGPGPALIAAVAIITSIATFGAGAA